MGLFYEKGISPLTNEVLLFKAPLKTFTVTMLCPQMILSALTYTICQKRCSQTGNRTPAAAVRAPNPNH
jgi:hypothetical protein